MTIWCSQIVTICFTQLVTYFLGTAAAVLRALHAFPAGIRCPARLTEEGPPLPSRRAIRPVIGLKRNSRCTFFQRGECPYGAFCRFAHYESELHRKPRGHTSQSSRMPLDVALEKTTMCAFYQHGGCNRGAYCRFAHDESELRLRPSLEKTQMCAAFVSGKCEKGEQCNFAHNAAELRIIQSVPTAEVAQETAVLPPIDAVIRERRARRSAYGKTSIGPVSATLGNVQVPLTETIIRAGTGAREGKSQTRPRSVNSNGTEPDCIADGKDGKEHVHFGGRSAQICSRGTLDEILSRSIEDMNVQKTLKQVENPAALSRRGRW